VVCATPPGGMHVLGLHLPGQVLTLHGARVVLLGANAPVEEIADGAKEHVAETVQLSAAVRASIASASADGSPGCGPRCPRACRSSEAASASLG
jgi:methanogenic corrinoid protein MtbC1